jgi:hypothetical protein
LSRKKEGKEEEEEEEEEGSKSHFGGTGIPHPPTLPKSSKR